MEPVPYSATEASGQNADAQAVQSLELVHIKIVGNAVRWLKLLHSLYILWAHHSKP